jgi:hypothetical protein
LANNDGKEGFTSLAITTRLVDDDKNIDSQLSIPLQLYQSYISCMNGSYESSFQRLFAARAALYDVDQLTLPLSPSLSGIWPSIWRRGQGGIAVSDGIILNNQAVIHHHMSQYACTSATLAVALQTIAPHLTIDKPIYDAKIDDSKRSALLLDTYAYHIGHRLQVHCNPLLSSVSLSVRLCLTIMLYECGI